MESLIKSMYNAPKYSDLEIVWKPRDSKHSSTTFYCHKHIVANYSHLILEFMHEFDVGDKLFITVPETECDLQSMVIVIKAMYGIFDTALWLGVIIGCAKFAMYLRSESLLNHYIQKYITYLVPIDGNEIYDGYIIAQRAKHKGMIDHIMKLMCNNIGWLHTQAINLEYMGYPIIEGLFARKELIPADEFMLCYKLRNRNPRRFENCLQGIDFGKMHRRNLIKISNLCGIRERPGLSNLLICCANMTANGAKKGLIKISD